MEEPLPAGGSCLLGSLNLSEFVTNKKFNEVEFCDAVKIAVRGLNQVLDEGLPKHPLKEQQDSVRDWRQIGLGIFGLADALIKMEIKYGSSKAIDFVHYMGSRLINSALEESAILAKEFGTYPKYDSRILESDFFKKNAGSEAIKLVKSYGLRNSQLLTCAPTGSLASLFNTSGSAEAIFATSYNRKTISLNNKETVYKVYPKIIQDFINSGYTENNLPEYVVTAHQVPYKKRLDMQAALNMYIDASISSTCNVPESISVEEIADLYMYAWESGCKGVTLWRDNCSREAILTTSNSKPIETTSVKFNAIPEILGKDDKERIEKWKKLVDSGIILTNSEVPSVKFNSISPISRKDLGVTVGATHCKKCACGTLYITTNLDKDGNLVEIFTHTSKGGICQANMNAVTRMISLGLRSGIKVDEIEDQLKGIHCPACQMSKAKGRDIDGMSCPDIISKTIRQFIDSGWSLCQEYKTDTPEAPTVNKTDKCPECGEPLVPQSGCWSCPSCGFSRCG